MMNVQMKEHLLPLKFNFDYIQFFSNSKATYTMKYDIEFKGAGQQYLNSRLGLRYVGYIKIADGVSITRSQLFRKTDYCKGCN